LVIVLPGAMQWRRKLKDFSWDFEARITHWIEMNAVTANGDGSNPLEPLKDQPNQSAVVSIAPTQPLMSRPGPILFLQAIISHISVLRLYRRRIYSPSVGLFAALYRCSQSALPPSLMNPKRCSPSSPMAYP
jgi:hypothetical protein